MADKVLMLCPVCRVRSLVAHCGDQAKTCTWHKCRNSDCDGVLDLRRGRGHVAIPGCKGRRYVTFGGAPA